MPTVDQYHNALTQATQAGDAEAVKYFQSQIDKGVRQPAAPAQTDAYGRDVPQGGSILSPIAQGLSFGWADEAGGALSGALAKMRGEDYTPAYEKSRDSYREAADQYAQRHPILSPAVEIGSGLLLPGGAARTAARGIGAGLAAGALTGAGKNQNPDTITEDAALGGALGGAGAGLAQGATGLFRAIVPRRAPRAAARGYQADVGALEAAGIPTTSAEQIGSKGARQAEKQTSAYLGGGEEIAARPAQLRSQIMARGGFDPEDVAAGELSDAALRNASTRLGSEYDRILQGHTVDIQDMHPALGAIEQRFFNTMLDHEQKAQVRQVLNSFEDELARNQTTNAQGQLSTPISGEAYKRMSSNLGKTARRLAKQTGENASLAPLYRDIQGALDDAFRASAPQALVRSLRTTDRQYAHYAFLRDVADNPENINNIASRINGSNVDRDLKNLARAYQNVIIRSGGEGATEASGSIIPPALSMMKAAGARVSAAVPRLPQLPRGVSRALDSANTRGAGQAAGMAVGSDSNRPGKRRRRDEERYQ